MPQRRVPTPTPDRHAPSKKLVRYTGAAGDEYMVDFDMNAVGGGAGVGLLDTTTPILTPSSTNQFWSSNAKAPTATYTASETETGLWAGVRNFAFFNNPTTTTTVRINGTIDPGSFTHQFTNAGFGAGFGGPEGDGEDVTSPVSGYTTAQITTNASRYGTVGVLGPFANIKTTGGFTPQGAFATWKTTGGGYTTHEVGSVWASSPTVVGWLDTPNGGDIDASFGSVSLSVGARGAMPNFDTDNVANTR